ncbi:MAG: hypothetical protein ABJA82_05060 [Myxococcales bacterium]
MPSGFLPVQIIDVTFGVGFGRQNDRADVMLVQAALNKIMSAPEGAGGLPDFSKTPVQNPLGQTFPPLPPLDVDGFFGNKTFTALKNYQSIMLAGRTALTVDGAVDPVHTQLAQLGGDPIGRNLLILTKVGRFTIFKLNADILTLFRRVLAESELPSLVQASIRSRERLNLSASRRRTS